MVRRGPRRPTSARTDFTLFGRVLHKEVSCDLAIYLSHGHFDLVQVDHPTGRGTEKSACA